MFGDDAPRHTPEGVEIMNGMFLFNMLDGEPVTTTDGSLCENDSPTCTSADPCVICYDKEN